MPKPHKKAKSLDIQTLLFAKPLTCSNFGAVSEIDAFVPTSGKWETIATVHTIGGLDAEDIADFIIKTLNNCFNGEQNG